MKYQCEDQEITGISLKVSKVSPGKYTSKD